MELEKKFNVIKFKWRAKKPESSYTNITYNKYNKYNIKIIIFDSI